MVVVRGIPLERYGKRDVALKWTERIFRFFVLCNYLWNYDSKKNTHITNKNTRCHHNNWFCPVHEGNLQCQHIRKYISCRRRRICWPNANQSCKFRRNEKKTHKNNSKIDFEIRFSKQRRRGKKTVNTRLLVKRIASNRSTSTNCKMFSFKYSVRQ